MWKEVKQNEKEKYKIKKKILEASSYLWECQKNANEKRNPIHFKRALLDDTQNNEERWLLGKKISYVPFFFTSLMSFLSLSLFFFISPILFYLLALMASSDQTGDWIISLTHRLKENSNQRIQQ